jgi:hypothetical protein
MAGKVIDEEDAPVRGALIQLLRGDAGYETRTDDGGIFYTQWLAAGNYKVGVLADGKYYKMRRLRVLPSDDKKFYIFSIRGGRLFVTIEGEDAFLKSQMARLLKSDPREDILTPGISRSKREWQHDPMDQFRYREHFLIQRKIDTIGHNIK